MWEWTGPNDGEIKVYESKLGVEGVQSLSKYQQYIIGHYQRPVKWCKKTLKKVLISESLLLAPLTGFFINSIELYAWSSNLNNQMLKNDFMLKLKKLYKHWPWLTLSTPGNFHGLSFHHHLDQSTLTFRVFSMAIHIVKMTKVKKIPKNDDKQCRPWSEGSYRSPLIWAFTACMVPVNRSIVLKELTCI